jgi:hypothetical protein
MPKFSTPDPPHAALSRRSKALLRLERSDTGQMPRRPPPNKRAQ